MMAPSGPASKDPAHGQWPSWYGPLGRHCYSSNL